MNAPAATAIAMPAPDPVAANPAYAPTVATGVMSANSALTTCLRDSVSPLAAMVAVSETASIGLWSITTSSIDSPPHALCAHARLTADAIARPPTTLCSPSPES